MTLAGYIAERPTGQDPLRSVRCERLHSKGVIHRMGLHRLARRVVECTPENSNIRLGHGYMCSMPAAESAMWT